MIPPTSIDGTDITGATIDGTDVTEITVDGQTVFSAGPPKNIIDDFNDNDLSEYSSTTGYETTSSDIIEGSHGLGFTGNNSAGFMNSLPGDGLDYYPEKGDKFSILMRAEEVGSNNSAPNFGFGSPDGNSGYAIGHFNFATWRLRRYDNGANLTLVDSGESVTDGEWYYYEIQWHDGSGSEPDNEIVITRYTVDTSADLTSELGKDTEQATVKANDSTYASGKGIFFDSGSSTINQITFADRIWHLGSVD